MCVYEGEEGFQSLSNSGFILELAFFFFFFCLWGFVCLGFFKNYKH